MFGHFGRKPHALRKLQMHEYLDLLRGGTEPTTLDEVAVQRARNAARDNWPALHTDSRFTSEESAATVRSRATGKTLLHFPTNPSDCFMILALERESLTPVEYIHFDVVAQYVQPVFICPELDQQGPLDEATIRDCIPRLRGGGDAAVAILELRNGTYMQTCASGERFELEHQLVNTASHYRTVETVTTDEVVTAFLSYAFGKYEWAYTHRWEMLAL